MAQAKVHAPKTPGLGHQNTTSHSAPSLTVLQRFVIRLRARWSGRVREIPVLREVMAIARFFASRRLGVGTAESLRHLAIAARWAQTGPTRALITKALAPRLTGLQAGMWRQHEVGMERYRTSFGGIEKKALTTSLLLKAPGPNGERGVLYSSFEYNWVRLVRHYDAKRFFEKYYLVGASSWSPPDFAAFGQLAGLSQNPVFIGVSHLSDLGAYRMAAPTIEPLPLMACDWVDPSWYKPKPRNERSIDILMVANWMKFKRHWLLFEALRDMPHDLRVVLVGRNGEGRTEDTIRQEARAFGVKQDLELHTGIPPEAVAELQADARISALFSQREGSSVAPVESMFADTPVAMMKGAHVGSIAHINEHTGVLVERRGLAKQLMDLLGRAEDMHPRRWASENISCTQSSEVLNTTLRDFAVQHGHAWTRDIAPLCWRYVPSYFRESDVAKLAPAVDELQAEFGIQLTKFKSDPLLKQHVA